MAPQPKPRWKEQHVRARTDILIPEKFHFAESDKRRIKKALRVDVAAADFAAFIETVEGEIAAYRAYVRIETNARSPAEVGAALNALEKPAQLLRDRLRMLDRETRAILAPIFTSLPDKISEEHFPDHRAFLLEQLGSPLDLHSARQRMKSECEQVFRPFRDLMHPLISDDAEHVFEGTLLKQHLAEAFHEGTQSLFTHVGDEVVEHTALAKQRVRASFDGISP